ncbi:decarboxylase [Streptomyces sp. NPDC026672]|uniref:maleate cis-trans isomerase family protein n=1 Tax=unclassified Streptomyces TaxID=2593676 RepID=UPI0034103584
MTALGFLYPGHGAEDDYPRLEQLLGSDIRLDLVHTTGGDGPPGVAALRASGAPERLAHGVDELRLAGAEAVVWASAGGSFVYGWEGAHEQVRALAVAAGTPASSTSFAFVHAVREVGARRVAVAAPYDEETAALFAEFLRAGGVEVTGVRAGGPGAAGPDGAGLIDMARAADRPDAEAVLIPDTGLRTVSRLPALEEALAKPVLTANQVTAWEALRLTDRRINAPALGTLFTREPIVQV